MSHITSICALAMDDLSMEWVGYGLIGNKTSGSSCPVHIFDFSILLSYSIVDTSTCDNIIPYASLSKGYRAVQLVIFH